MEDKMKKVKHIGEGYHGYDTGSDIHIFVKKDETVVVSDVKAEQLFCDFPKEWVSVDDEKETVTTKKGWKK